MRLPDITVKKFGGCQAPMEPVRTQALISFIVALRKLLCVTMISMKKAFQGPNSRQKLNQKKSGKLTDMPAKV